MTAQDIQTKALQRIRADVRAMQGYHVQPAQGLLKMDTMENPYRLPPELQQKLGEHLGGLEINRYPGERQEVLKDMLARYAQAPAGSAVLLGNGSDELISLLALACDVPSASGQPASILAPVPGFVMYAMSAQLQGLAFHGVPLTADFELDETAMLAAIRQHNPAIVYLAYPNNPTGAVMSAAEMEEIAAVLRETNVLVLSDEIYSELTYGLDRHVSIASLPGMAVNESEVLQKLKLLRHDALAHAADSAYIAPSTLPELDRKSVV